MFIWLLPFAALWAGVGLAFGAQSIAIQAIFGTVMLVLTNLYAALVVPSVIGHYATTPRFAAMFELREILTSIRRIGSGALGVWIVHLTVLVLTFITIWTVFAIIFTTAYAAMDFGHAYGQAARIGPARQRATDLVEAAHRTRPNMPR